MIRWLWHSLGVSDGLMESIVPNANHIISIIGETKAGLEDMCARIVEPISMTFQAQFSIRAKFLLMSCYIFCLIWIRKQPPNCLKSWITADNAFQGYLSYLGISY